MAATSWPSDGDVPQQISDILRDATYHQLAGNFLMTSKGRRPSLPNVKSTNRVYMQMYLMRIVGAKSWIWVQESLGKLFPEYPVNRFRSLVEKVYNGCVSASDLSNYLCQPVDLQYVGPICHSHGISRNHLLQIIDLPKVKSDELTNGLLLELENFRSRDKLTYATMIGWLSAIQPDIHLSEKALKSDIGKLTKKFTQLNKSKAIYPEALSKFMNQMIHGCPVMQSKTLDTTDNAKPVDQYKSGTDNVLVERKTDNNACNTDTCDNDNTEMCPPKCKTEMCPPKCKTCRSLRITTEKCQKLHEEMKLQIAALEEVIALKNRELAFTAEEIVQRDSKLIKLENTITKLKQELRSLQLTLEKCNDRKRSLLKKLKERRATVDSHQAKIDKLKQTIKQIQTRESNFKQRTEQYVADKREMKKQIEEIQATNDHLHLELNQQLFQCEDSSDEIKLTPTPKLKTRTKGTTFSHNIRKCMIALQGEAGVAAKRCGLVIQLVAQHLFNINIPAIDLPSEKTVLNMADEGHWLSKFQVGESLKTERFDLHSDGTSRDHKKIIGHQVTLQSGKNLSLGFRQVAVEDSATLLDIAIEILQELSSILDDKTEEDNIYREILQNLCSTMADRASVNKKFNKDLNEHRQSKLDTDENIEFLHCNAHFLLGLSTKCETSLKEIEKEIESTVGHKLGRNQESKFQSFKGSETSTARVIRTGSDCLGPRGDEKSGCRQDWLAYCKESDVKSEVSSFRMNRFNNFFQGAGALYHHRKDIVDFLSGGYLRSVNLKLESVLHDIKSPEIRALLRALGIIYVKITGPYWKLMKSDTHYLDLHKFIQKLLGSLEIWSKDASPLLSENEPCVFDKFEVKKDSVYTSLYDTVTPAEEDITKKALQQLMLACACVVEKQMADFLVGGIYGAEPSKERRTKMSHCRLHNLVSEYAFGDLDYSQHRRRNTSLHHHSTLEMLKHNETVSNWLVKKCDDVQNVLLTKAREQGGQLRQSHRESEKAVIAKRREILKANKEKRLQAARKTEEKKKTIVSMVRKHGGPCTTTNDVKALESRCEKKNRLAFRQALIWELKFLKEVLGMKHEKLRKIVGLGLKDVNVLRENLMSVLDSDRRPDTTNNPLLHCVDSHLGEVDVDGTVTSVSEQLQPTISIKTTKAQHSKSSSRKKKAVEQPGEQPSKLTRLDYQFTRQADWVAVAYDKSWYLGQVLSVQSCDKGIVQFLKHIRGCMYVWPSVEDVAEIDSIHVFDADIEVSTANGRVWMVPQNSTINNKYQKVKHLYG